MTRETIWIGFFGAALMTTLLVLPQAMSWPSERDTDATEAARQDAEAQASRDWVAQRVCAGRPHTWADDKTLVCAQ